MSALVIDYKELATISSHANDLAKKAEAYADSLTRKITNKFDSVAGGVNGTLVAQMDGAADAIEQTDAEVAKAFRG